MKTVTGPRIIQVAVYAHFLDQFHHHVRFILCPLNSTYINDPSMSKIRPVKKPELKVS